MRRVSGVRHAGGATGAAVLAAACLGISAWTAGASDAAVAHAACPGRTLLTCGEKREVYLNFATAEGTFVLEGELFETPLAGRIHSAALRRFWLYESASAAARGLISFELGQEIADTNFEAVYKPPALPTPTVRPDGLAGRRLATALSALMRAQQAEMLNVLAMTISLNRATEAAAQRTRPDWVSGQEATAAGYARRAAVAITHELRAQGTVSQRLQRGHLLFGLGSADLAGAHQLVREHGLAGSLTRAMRALGMDSQALALCAKTFLKTTFGQQSFSLTRYLVDSKVVGFEKGFRSALTHFASRVPTASRPSQ